MDSKLIEKWTKAGQEHVFEFKGKLSSDELEKFATQLKAIDIDGACQIFKQSVVDNNAAAAAGGGAGASADKSISPFKAITVAKNCSPDQRAQWRKQGLEAIGQGKVATLLLAGGQGTRLGYDHPKGMYDLGLPSHKSLFQLHAERQLKATRLAAGGNEAVVPSVPWYVMTSGPTHAETVSFFEQHQFFGLPRADVFFFQQGTLPCFTPQGKVILAGPGTVAEAPDGNGGVYLSLLRSGALDDMERRGIQLVCQYGVDNCLSVPVDPEFVGFQLAEQADCCPKVVAKASPQERVGVMAVQADGRPAVVEYSEISEEMANLRENDDPNGPLVYRACHICINNFSVPFLRQIVTAGSSSAITEYHVAKKAIPSSVAPPDQGGKISGIKLEAFIFDVFPRAQRLVAFECDRDDEFAPLKNASGDSSPETCRDLVYALARRRITAAGGSITDTSVPCEVSPLVSLQGEGLDSLCKGKQFPVTPGEPIVI